MGRVRDLCGGGGRARVHRGAGLLSLLAQGARAGAPDDHGRHAHPHPGDRRHRDPRRPLRVPEYLRRRVARGGAVPHPARLPRHSHQRARLRGPSLSARPADGVRASDAGDRRESGRRPASGGEREPDEQADLCAHLRPRRRDRRGWWSFRHYGSLASATGIFSPTCSSLPFSSCGRPVSWAGRRPSVPWTTTSRSSRSWACTSCWA